MADSGYHMLNATIFSDFRFSISWFQFSIFDYQYLVFDYHWIFNINCTVVAVQETDGIYEDDMEVE